MPIAFLKSLAILLILSASFAEAQTRPTAAPAQPRTAAPTQTVRKAADLIRKQEGLKINQALLKQATPDSVHIIVSIPKQRAYLIVGEQIVIDAPVSSGNGATAHRKVISRFWKKTPIIIPVCTAISWTAADASFGRESARGPIQLPVERASPARR